MKFIRQDMPNGETFVIVQDDKGKHVTRFFVGPAATDEQVGYKIAAYAKPEALEVKEQPILSEVTLENEGGKTIARITESSRAKIDGMFADRSGVELRKD